MKMVFSEHYDCDCHSEGVIMEYEDDLPLAYLGFFNMGFGGRVLAFKDRIRSAFQVLKTGKPYTDMVVLNQEAAKRLGSDLLAFSHRSYEKVEEK